MCLQHSKQVIATHKHAHTLIWFLLIQEALPLKTVAPNDRLKTSALDRTRHHLSCRKSPVRWIKLQIWRYRGTMFTVYINDYWTFLQMVVILSIENRCKGGQRLQHDKAVMMKDMWIIKTILIVSLLLYPHHFADEVTVCRKGVKCKFISCSQKGRKIIAPTTPCYIFWATEGFVVEEKPTLSRATS